MLASGDSAGGFSGAGGGWPSVASGTGKSCSRCASAVNSATSLPPAVSRPEKCPAPRPRWSARISMPQSPIGRGRSRLTVSRPIWAQALRRRGALDGAADQRRGRPGMLVLGAPWAAGQRARAERLFAQLFVGAFRHGRPVNSAVAISLHSSASGARGERAAGAAVPIGGVAFVALLAVEIGVHPVAVAAFVALRECVRAVPVAFGVAPQCGERRRQSRRRVGVGERGAEFCEDMALNSSICPVHLAASARDF